MNRAERRASWIEQHRETPPSPAALDTAGAVPGSVSPDIHVWIDSLSLDGLGGTSRRDRDALGQAVGAELERLLALGRQSPSWRGPGEIARLAGPSIRVGSDQRPAALGRQIAGAVAAAAPAPMGSVPGRRLP